MLQVNLCQLNPGLKLYLMQIESVERFKAFERSRNYKIESLVPRFMQVLTRDIHSSSISTVAPLFKR